MTQVIDSSDAKYGLSPLTGFAPEKVLPSRLEGPATVWEDIWQASSDIQLSDDSDAAQSWRKQVEELDIVTDTSFLMTEAHLQRAHMLLAYIAHRYCWSIPAVHDASVPVVPDAIAKPWLAISRQLELPPVITYADLVLWNFNCTKPESETDIDNFDVPFNFTNTRQEAHFYLVSLMIERIAAPSLALMCQVLDQLVKAEPSLQVVEERLLRLGNIMDKCTTAFGLMRPGLDPAFFYHQIRPWFSAGPRLLAGELVDWGGGSAAQSSVVPAWDVFLGVDHRAEQPELSFAGLMAKHMPAGHRRFLLDLGAVQHKLRDFVIQHASLQEAYDGCIEALRRVRDAHTKIVHTYIVKFARAETDGPIYGSAGSDLTEFLKETRARTMEALLT